jgi:hypothetical protein
MGNEILTGGMLLAFTAYGELYVRGLFLLGESKQVTFRRWKKLRRAAHEGLNRRVSSSYEPVQEREALALVKSMIEEPNAWDHHLKRKAMYATYIVTY